MTALTLRSAMPTQVKGHERAAVIELVDMTRFALDQFTPVGKGIVCIGRGKILPV